jgi:serine/threonine protein phosphatase PrpC
MLKADEDGSGSTGVVVLFDGRKSLLTVAGVGDSLCVLSRNGRAIVMNKMHRLDFPAEKERVRNNGGTVINNR